MALKYKMNRRRRGKAIIIYNKKFQSLKPLRGSHHDLKNMTSGLVENGFVVKPYADQSKSKIMEIASSVAGEDHSDADCMVFCIISHGSKGGICGTDYKGADDAIDIQNIVDLFIGDNCPSLVDKPKIFIINACRGTKKDHGVDNTMSGTRSASPLGTPIPNQPKRIPKSADILIFTSSHPGYYSYMNPKKGSYFMESLGQHLVDYGQVKPLREIFDMVKNVVAAHEVNGKAHQMPYVKETLRKQIYFGQNWESRNNVDDRPQSVVDSRHLIPHHMAMTSEDQTTDIQLPVLPLSSEGDLTTLETYLKKSNEKVNEILLEKFRSVRGIKNYTDNVLNALMTPELASNYNWKGVQEKKPFKDLRLVEFVLKAVRKEYPEATFSDIKESIKPWLTDAHTKTTA